MLTKKQITQIREHLNKAQNPLFLFDNDQDGLCSFLLLQRYLQRGKGFPVKTLPLNRSYMRKVNELSPDYLFILDVALVEKEFFEEIEKINLPIVWIDHHPANKIYTNSIPNFVSYYNPTKNKSVPSATTYMAYEITQKKEDIWLAVIGCISDNLVPEFYEDFKKTYPNLAIDSKNAAQIYYNSEIGKIAKILGSGLKDRTTNVIKMLKFLMNAQNPSEVFEESPKNREMHEKFNEIEKKYNKFLDKAKEKINTSDKLIFFEYGGETSMSSEIANGLKNLFPEKMVFVAYVKEGFVNLSARGKNIKKILEKILKKGEFENSRGGGHKEAVGARIMKKDLEKFKEIVKKIVGK